MTPWLVLDYGEVVCRPPAEHVWVDLAARVGVDADLVQERYWAPRREADAGLSARDYWSAVAGRDLSEQEVTALVAVDREAWAVLDPEVLDLMREQRSAGVRLAVLSNAPQWQADAFDEAEWTSMVEAMFVSARLGLLKPDPAIFEHVLAELGVAPSDVTFVDDRQDNIDGAAAVGFRAIRFSAADDLRRQLA